MKNKDAEDMVIKALDEYASKHDAWNTEIDQITKEAFAAHRVHVFTEHRNKVLENIIEAKDKEIWQHQKAIDNLRGYMGFLESRIESLQLRLGEHENSY